MIETVHFVVRPTSIGRELLRAAGAKLRTSWRQPDFRTLGGPPTPDSYRAEINRTFNLVWHYAPSSSAGRVT